MTREEAINVFKHTLAYDSDLAEAFRMAIEALSAKPTGEWIDIDNYYRTAICSHCNKVTMFEKWGKHIKPYNYCPNCGAEMEVEHE